MNKNILGAIPFTPIVKGFASRNNCIVQYDGKLYSMKKITFAYHFFSITFPHSTNSKKRFANKNMLKPHSSENNNSVIMQRKRPAVNTAMALS